MILQQVVKEPATPPPFKAPPQNRSPTFAAVSAASGMRRKSVLQAGNPLAARVGPPSGVVSSNALPPLFMLQAE